MISNKTKEINDTKNKINTLKATRPMSEFLALPQMRTDAENKYEQQRIAVKNIYRPQRTVAEDKYRKEVQSTESLEYEGAVTNSEKYDCQKSEQRTRQKSECTRSSWGVCQQYRYYNETYTHTWTKKRGCDRNQTVPKGLNIASGSEKLDKWCFEGQKLKKLKGNYGKVGSEYTVRTSPHTRLWIEKYKGGAGCSLKIDGMANCSFKVRRPNGNVLEFRQQADRRQMHLYRVTDTSGNYMEVKWANWGQNETVLREILYTGTAHHAPTRRVFFKYRHRYDKYDRYWGGRQFNLHHILFQIDVDTNEGPGWERLTEYRLNYRRGYSTKRNLLSWIQMCGKSHADEGGSGKMVCLPETSFQYSDGSKDGPLAKGTGDGQWLKWPSKSNGNPQSNEKNIKMVADSNGDGLQDLVWILSGWTTSSDAWHVGNSKRKIDKVCTAVSTGKAFVKPHCVEHMAWSERSDTESYSFVDINSDGASDVVAFSKTHKWLSKHGIISLPGKPIDGGNLKTKKGQGYNNWYVAASKFGAYHKPDSVNEKTSDDKRNKCARDGGYAYCNDYTKREFKDVNGDGILDLVIFGMKNIKVGLGKNPDLNNYQNSDIGKFEKPIAWLGKAHSSGEGSPTFKNGSWQELDYPRMLCDINGDGLPDIVGFGHGGTSVWWNSGKSFASKDSGFSNGQLISDFGFAQDWRAEGEHKRTCADVNGDGMADLIGFGENKTIIYVSTGTGFKHFKSISGFANNNWDYGEEIRGVQDLNGDGLADIYGFESSGKIIVSFATGTGFTKETAVSTGGSFTIAKGHGWKAGKHPRFFMDVNGDGCPDLIGYSNAGAEVRVNKSCDTGLGIKPDVLVKVFDGHAINAGQSWDKERKKGIEITYGTLNHPVHGLIKNDRYKEDSTKHYLKNRNISLDKAPVRYPYVRQKHASPIVKKTIIRDRSKSGHQDRSHDREVDYYYEDYIAPANRAGVSGGYGVHETRLKVKKTQDNSEVTARLRLEFYQVGLSHDIFLRPSAKISYNSKGEETGRQRFYYRIVRDFDTDAKTAKLRYTEVYRGNPHYGDLAPMAYTTKSYDDNGLLIKEQQYFTEQSRNTEGNITKCYSYLKKMALGFEKPTSELVRRGSNASCGGTPTINDSFSKMEYDSKGRIYRRTAGSGESAPGQGIVRQETDFFYDSYGRLKKVIDPSGLERHYDDYDRHHRQRRTRVEATNKTIGAGKASDMPIVTQKTTYTRRGEVATIKKGVDGISEDEWIHSKTEYDAFGRSIRVFSQNPVVKAQVDLIRQIRYLKPPADAHWLGTFAMMSFGRPDGAGEEWCGTFKICGDYMDTDNFSAIANSTIGNYTFAHEYSDTFGQVIRSEKHGLNSNNEIRVFKNEFNEMGNVIRKYMPWSNTQGGSDKGRIYQEFTYLNATDNVATASQMHGGYNLHETRYEYGGPGGLRIRKHFPSPSGSGESTITIQKSIEGKQIWKELPNGAMVRSYYNAHGLLTSMEDPIGGVVTKTYDSLGNTKSQCKADLGCEYFTYNKLGKVIAKLNGNGEATRFAFDKLGRPSTIMNSDGLATTYIYNAMGAPGVVIDGYGNSEAMTYNLAGDVVHTIQTIDGKPYVSASSAEGHSILPTGDRLYMADVYKGVKRKVFLNGKVIAEAKDFDALGQSRILRYANGDVATASYDKYGKNTGLKVNCGNGTGFAKDGEWTGGSGGSVCHRENSTFDDSIGKLVSVSRTTFQGKNNKGIGGEAGRTNLNTNYTYDSMGRLTNTNTNVGHNQSFNYDLNSNLTGVGGSDAVSYNMKGNGSSRLLTTSKGPRYTYDKAGRVITKTAMDSKGSLGKSNKCVIFFQHGSYGGKQYKFCPGSNPLPLGQWNDDVSSFKIPSGAKLKVCEHVGGGGQCWDHTSNSSWVGGPQNDLYSYFELSFDDCRMTSEDAGGCTSNATGTVKKWKFRYESQFNRVIEIDGPEGKTIFVRNAAGGVTKMIKPNGEIKLNIGPGVQLRKTAVGTINYSVSVALMGKHVHTYTRNVSNTSAAVFNREMNHNTHKLMAGMVDPSSLIGLAKYVRHKVSQLLTRPNFEQELMKGFCFLFAIGLLLSMVINIFRKRAVGKVKWWHYPMLITIFTVTTVLPVHALPLRSGLQGTGEYELGAQFFHTDHLGNVAVVTNDKGKITSSTAYDSYGQMLTKGVSSFGRDNFPNKWAKAEYVRERGADSGLSVMGARIYDRDARRFLSPDPLSVFHSPYRYSSDPISNADPTGEEPFTIACIVIFALIALFTTGYAISGTWKFWEWSGETWGYAILGGIAGALFAAAAAFALPALAAACATACPGVAAAAGGTAGVTSAAGLKALALQAVVLGTIGAAEAAVASMITQAGNAAVNGRAFDWSKVGKAAAMGFAMGAGFAVAGAVAGSVIKPMAKKATNFISKVAKKGAGGAGKLMKKIGTATGKMFGKVDDVMMGTRAAGGWTTAKKVAGTVGSKIGRVCRATGSTIFNAAKKVGSKLDDAMNWVNKQVSKLDDPKALKDWLDNPGNWKGHAEASKRAKLVGTKVGTKGTTMSADDLVMDMKLTQLDDAIAGCKSGCDMDALVKAREGVYEEIAEIANKNSAKVGIDDLHFASDREVLTLRNYETKMSGAGDNMIIVRTDKKGGTWIHAKGQKDVVIPPKMFDEGALSKGQLDDFLVDVKGKYGDDVAAYLGENMKPGNFLSEFDSVAVASQFGNVQKGIGSANLAANLGTLEHLGDVVFEGCTVSPHEEGCAAVQSNTFFTIWAIAGFANAGDIYMSILRLGQVQEAARGSYEGFDHGATLLGLGLRWKKLGAGYAGDAMQAVIGGSASTGDWGGAGCDPLDKTCGH
ncbi:FG-GAP-like repeat-containing protein [Bacteriovoracales bacterium]|nr:FG-GAP-like repeat-containing protein [Bacteriovoracales bacterium]